MKTFAMAAAAALLTTTAPALAFDNHESAGMEEAGTIVDVASGNDMFGTLVAAVTAADLADTLSGPGPYTVFAPTDAAFEKLPAGTVEMLLQPENKDKLTEILTYHVVPGSYMAADLQGKTMMAPTAAGAELSIDATDGVSVNDASVVKADVKASNGVIHVIDTVLMPPSN
ncbi:hypothetical protein B5C34_03370 [Pacificimonas flava]|uniref:FAS1 domain-containing protein n=2 Tax=Pacificimonas TaxID=1960290 RepID=A0A219B372_9SPHN|nr:MULTISPECIES: fasciclin domain-containing protein [Pacificimonas]MBZ6377742.1 fasciclin domain-containing protein [Pacificimonas aurantium]OWV32583.1 hypothetical protein B5C34_03370 [Pacificimonas flava]